MNKVTIMLAAAVLSTSALTADCASNFSGFYAGLQAGINATTTKYGKGINDDLSSPVSLTKRKTSFLGGIFAGYGVGVSPCVYIGAEFYANFADNSTKLEGNLKNTRENVVLKYRSNSNFGGKFRLGYTVSPQAMIFLGIGAEYAKTKLTVGRGSNEEYRNWSRPRASFGPSIGTDMFLNKNVFVRGEYTYLFGSRQSFKDDKTVGEGIKVNANQHRFVVGVGYKF